MAQYSGLGDIFFTAPVAFGMVGALRKFLDLPRRLPRWNPYLTWIWVPVLVLYLAAQAFGFWSPKLGDAYWLLVLGMVLAVLGVAFVVKK